MKMKGGEKKEEKPTAQVSMMVTQKDEMKKQVWEVQPLASQDKEEKYVATHIDMKLSKTQFEYAMKKNSGRNW